VFDQGRFSRQDKGGREGEEKMRIALAVALLLCLFTGSASEGAWCTSAQLPLLDALHRSAYQQWLEHLTDRDELLWHARLYKTFVVQAQCRRLLAAQEKSRAQQ